LRIDKVFERDPADLWTAEFYLLLDHKFRVGARRGGAEAGDDAPPI
jgi:hypothetical protein